MKDTISFSVQLLYFASMKRCIINYRQGTAMHHWRMATTCTLYLFIIILTITVLYRLPYSTEITPTPNFEWKFLHRLISLENTPTRKSCICQWLSQEKVVSCVSWLALNIARYSNQSLQTRTIFSESPLKTLTVTGTNLLMQNLDLYTFLYTQLLYTIVVYWCIHCISRAGRPQTHTEKT